MFTDTCHNCSRSSQADLCHTCSQRRRCCGCHRYLPDNCFEAKDVDICQVISHSVYFFISCYTVYEKQSMFKFRRKRPKVKLVFLKKIMRCKNFVRIGLRTTHDNTLFFCRTVTTAGTDTRSDMRSMMSWSNIHCRYHLQTQPSNVFSIDHKMRFETFCNKTSQTRGKGVSTFLSALL